VVVVFATAVLANVRPLPPHIAAAYNLNRVGVTLPGDETLQPVILDGDDAKLATTWDQSMILGDNLGFANGDKVCATTGVNIRPSAGTSGSPLFTASTGEQFTVASSQTWSAEGLTWIKLSGRGKEGYAASKYFQACGSTGGGGGGPCVSDTSNARDKIVTAAWALYNQRANGHYTQDSRRWSGIANKVCPSSGAPPYSDCSSSTTWCYWTVFGNGPDFINGANWKAGYTGTQVSHGKEVTLAQAKPADLVFYGKSHSDISHVAIYVGGGKVISHGSDPVGYYGVDYRTDRQQIRSYIP
jgi:hypothetical protein